MAKTLQLGTIADVPLLVDVDYLGGDLAPVSVLMTSDYVMLAPPGNFPVRPCFIGISPQVTLPRTIHSGDTIKLFRCEALALVDAGAGTLA